MSADFAQAHVVEARLRRLQENYLAGESSARAALSHLRRSIGKPPGSIPEVWSITALPTGEYRGDTPTYEENAAHWVFGLYARHQQSQASPMHVRERSAAIGSAVRTLAYREDSGSETNGVERRFQAAASAATLAELGMHLASLIGRLRSNAISVDYVQLYKDLVRFQQPGGRHDVQRRWARDYVAMPSSNEDSALTHH